MKGSKKYWIILFAILAIPFRPLTAQEEKKLQPELGCDIVSSYIWRGSAVYATLGDQNVLSPSLQPGFALGFQGLKLGAWGSVDFTGTYKELDYYLSYSLKGFTLSVTDYYWASDWINDNFFEYGSDSTSHYLEASLAYKGEKIPVSILVATMLYGADKQFDDPAKNNYSTYIEVGYGFKVSDYKLDLFLGMTPSDGMYGDGYGGRDGFAIVNAGVTGSKTIKITENWSLPVKASLIANPQARKLFLAFILSI
ncbi:MAG TPA: hypothetical protein PLW31_03460 [Bacteroidales bacterium]|nr:hypothetical protein [Bacteroidales bacterium]HOX77074.1 hypothetical protein [Bacteroidales bacterium]HPI84860.1 hypothetical protein [Bacteroidales bacterium]HPM92098.1 hypothetical protein [Bacteroidales bacterium]